MSETRIKGKEILIARPSMTIFSLFEDMGRFVSSIPEPYKNQVSATQDSITFNHNGISLGVVVEERVPFTLVSMHDDGKSPFPFRLSFNMLPTGLDSTLFHIELVTEMNPMIKMMIGNKLQEMVDRMSDQIEKVMASGQVPDMDAFRKEYFS